MLEGVLLLALSPCVAGSSEARDACMEWNVAAYPMGCMVHLVDGLWLRGLLAAEGHAREWLGNGHACKNARCEVHTFKLYGWFRNQHGVLHGVVYGSPLMVCMV